MEMKVMKIFIPSQWGIYNKKSIPSFVCGSTTTNNQETFLQDFSRNSEAYISEFLENLE